MWLNRNQNNIGAAGSFGGGGFGVGRGIDNDDINALLLGLVDGSAKSGGMSRNYPRMFILSPVCPFGGGGLRVNVDDSGFLSLLDGGDGQIKSKGCLSNPALLCDNSNSIHVYTYTLQ